MRHVFRAAALAAALALPALAGAQQAARSGKDDGDAAVPAQAAAVDARSGKLREPTREEVAELMATLRTMLAQDPSRVKHAALADGTRIIGLDESFMNVSVATVQRGEVKARCVESAREAEAFLSGKPVDAPKAAAPALEEK